MVLNFFRIPLLAAFLALGLPFFGIANAGQFKKIMIVIFENTDADKAAKQPFFAEFAKMGASFDNFYAETHPSQANYVALISGALQNIRNDSNVDIDALHIGDLLESAGKSWKVYAEDYPGNCFLGAKKDNYVRKHVPFLSFKSVQSSAAKCANIQDVVNLDSDIEKGTLPEFSLYIPNLQNDGHDTNVEFADAWAGKFIPTLLSNPKFMQDMLVVLTFDESSLSGKNRIYAAFFGNMVKGGVVNHSSLNHYSILRTVEDNLGLGTLHKNDETATIIDGIWK